MQNKLRHSTIVVTGILFVVFLGIMITGFTLWQGIQDQKSQSNTLASQLQKAEKRISALEAVNKFDEKQVKKDRYQAVFLTNDQVYFGKITAITKETIKIEDIYYLRGGSVDRSGNNATPDTNLVKLGQELHGPEDVMLIERKNVAFWENIKPDSEVSQAIDDYKKSNGR